MLILVWIVHSTFYESKTTLLLSLVLYLTKTDILCWDHAELADNVIEVKLDKLVKVQILHKLGIQVRMVIALF